MTSTLTATPPQLHENLQPQKLRQAIERILISGKITEIDRQCLLKVALTDAPIHPQDAALIRQIFDQLRIGLLRVVD